MARNQATVDYKTLGLLGPGKQPSPLRFLLYHQQLLTSDLEDMRRKVLNVEATPSTTEQPTPSRSGSSGETVVGDPPPEAQSQRHPLTSSPSSCPPHVVPGLYQIEIDSIGFGLGLTSTSIAHCSEYDRDDPYNGINKVSLHLEGEGRSLLNDNRNGNLFLRERDQAGSSKTSLVVFT